MISGILLCVFTMGRKDKSGIGIRNDKNQAWDAK